MVDPSDHVTVSMRKRRKTTAILGFFRRFIRKPELILAECAAAPWDAVGSSELSEEFRTFRLFFFWPILHGRRRWHARPPQLFQRISGMRCSWGRPSVENIVTSSRNRIVLFLVVWNTCLLRAPVGVCGNRFHPHIAH